MRHAITILGQLLSLLPAYQFDSFVGQHAADKYTKTMSCWQQLAVMLYAQASGKDSLRDIETGLSVHAEKLYHLGIESVARSTLADANAHRPAAIFESLFYALLKRVQGLSPEKQFSFPNPLRVIDSTTITLCLTLFPWATYRTRKGALKLHYDFNVTEQLPEFVVHTDGNASDIKTIKESGMTVIPDSIYAVDRAYIDWKWLYEEIHLNGAYFVVRAKTTTMFTVLEDLPAGEGGIISDQRIMLSSDNAVRLVTYYDEKKKKALQFITNNFDLSAKTIADAYKARWEIELFFKWIKQNLKIRTFLGTSENAVMIQVWVAMIYYLLVAYIKKQTKIACSMLELTRMIAATLMDRVHLVDILALRVNKLHQLQIRDGPQLALF